MTNKSLKIVMGLTRLSASISRRFSIQGLGIGEFMVLHYLNDSAEGHVRRVDLAENLGLTASGVTRMLIPMEKIGLVKRISDKTDARVSLVALAPSGKRILSESRERAEVICDDLLSSSQNQLSEIITLAGK